MSTTTSSSQQTSTSRRSSVPNTRSATNTLSAVPPGFNPLRQSASSGIIASSRSQVSASTSGSIGKQLDPIQESSQHQQPTVIGAKLGAINALKKQLEKDSGKQATSINSPSSNLTTTSQPVTVATARVSRTASASLPSAGGGGNQVSKTNVTKPARRESVAGNNGLSGTGQPQTTIISTANNNNNSHFYPRSRPQTPSSRERSLNAKNQQHNHQEGQKSPIPSDQQGQTDEHPQHNHEIGNGMNSSGDSKPKVRPKSFWGGWWRF